ncbi:MAG: methyltransferase domain-containing protein [Patescibacteria group bacterium]|jgi:predicted O-methyltransferase YrrM
MNHFENQHTESPNTKIDELLKKLADLDIHLEQETADTEQLSPQERIKSIKNVWDAIKAKLDNPETALDVGSGFGYGTVVLDMEGIKTVGIESVPIKNQQAVALFQKVDIILHEIDEIDFEKSPAILEADFNKLDEKEIVDLITMFYLSEELVSKEKTFQMCEQLLKKNGQIVLATEADRATVETIISSGNIKLPANFSVEIIDLPNNFEKTVIILTKI